jgi:hypothetical protein
MGRNISPSPWLESAFFQPGCRANSYRPAAADGAGGDAAAAVPLKSAFGAPITPLGAALHGAVDGRRGPRARSGFEPMGGQQKGLKSPAETSDITSNGAEQSIPWSGRTDMSPSVRRITP